ncbi:MAG: DUF427 domain-containing protein [Candidatus Bathyarchaeia archaeon]
MVKDNPVELQVDARQIEVVIDGVKIASTRQPVLLFEGKLPTRYYIPRQDVRMDLLQRSDTVTYCPYKGTTETFSVRIGEKIYKDYAWSYPNPIPHCQKIAGFICFYNEHVDIYNDGQLLGRPTAKD